MDNKSLLSQSIKFLIGLLIIFGTSCIDSGKLPDDYIERFNSNKADLDVLVDLLRSDPAVKDQYGVTFKCDSLSEITKKKMKKLGIYDVHVFTWGRRIQQFDFKTNWRTKEPIHLWYNTMDSVSTIKGYYNKDKGNNEMWGQGDRWMLWVERKLLEPKI
jgi:hypothetical protein